MALSLLKLLTANKHNMDDHWDPVDLETDPDLVSNKTLETAPGFSNIFETSTQRLLGSMVSGQYFPNESLKLDSGNKGTKMTLAPNGRTRVSRSSNSISSAFYLRLKVNTCDDVSAILDHIQHMHVYLEIGGSQIITIPTLTLNFLILEKLQEMGRKKTKGINIFNLREWKQSKTEEDIKNTVIIHQNEAASCINRYFVAHQDDIYLDIPLLFDFFSYGIDLCLVALQYHDVNIVFMLPPENYQILQGMISSDMYVYPECSTVLDASKSQEATRTPTENVLMQCNTQLHTVSPNNIINIRGNTNTKFLFVIIKSSEPDLDVIELPEIAHVTIATKTLEHHELDTNMFYVADYDKKIRLYVISPDPDQDTRGWIEIIKEFKGTDHDTAFRRNNCTNARIQFPPTNIDMFFVKLNSWEPHVTVETHVITQNIMRTMSGMSGLVYSS